MIVVRLALTALLVLGAVFAVDFIWTNYFESPWTRDARVWTYYDDVASYVSGKITELPVHNNSVVKKGDVLMVIDPESYQVALQQAQAQVDEARANIALQANNSDRLTALQREDSSAVAAVDVVHAQDETRVAQAQLASAEANLRVAKINLERTVIRSRADGYVTNLVAVQGDYAQPGSPLMAVVDAHSYRVDVFFMETALRRVKPGDNALIHLMASNAIIPGTVRSISRAIADTQNPRASNLLQALEPSFEWIRLAQRIPVEIGIDRLPPDVPLVAGMTATVIIEPVTVEPGLFNTAVSSLRALFHVS